MSRVRKNFSGRYTQKLSIPWENVEEFSIHMNVAKTLKQLTGNELGVPVYPKSQRVAN